MPISTRPYQICVNCIMDTSDSKIVFDDKGRCEYCNNYSENILPNWHTDARGEAEISAQIERIKADGKGKEHDCLIGLSGGVDSSYVTYLAKEKFGLRPLLYHVDAGWNSQQAVNNIEKLVDGLGLDLFTEVVNWREMQDLQLAFFKAGATTEVASRFTEGVDYRNADIDWSQLDAGSGTGSGGEGVVPAGEVTRVFRATVG